MRYFLIALVALCPFAIETAQAEDNIKDSIVHVYTTANPYDYTQPWKKQGQQSCTGSGVIVAGDRILTNAHVVADQTFIQVRRAGQAKKFVAEVEAVSHAQDLALLVVAEEAFFAGSGPLELGSLPRPGDAVVTYGFPEGGTRLTVTEGVVSRIEHMEYGHTKLPNLACQIDAAINSGSSGGPVVSGGKIVGLALQLDEEGENIGYMIPAPVIEHFLTDLEDGRHDGVPDLPFTYQPMENPSIRAYYGMAENQSGVLITEVPNFLRGDHKLQPRDIVLAVDGFDVANDGTIEFRKGERVVFDYANERKQIGEPITLTLFRDEQVIEVDVLLEFPKKALSYLVPRYQYDVVPPYYIVGGLVFMPLTFNYMVANIDELPLELFRYIDDGFVAKTALNPEIVLLTDVLSDEINTGYEVYVNDVVREVNGKKITSMQDLVEAFEGHIGEDYHRIVVGTPGASPTEIVLSTSLVAARGRAILENYQVPSDRSVDLMGKVSRVSVED